VPFVGIFPDHVLSMYMAVETQQDMCGVLCAWCLEWAKSCHFNKAPAEAKGI